LVKEVFIKVKHLIKKILREEADTDDFFSDARRRKETGGNEIENRVRILMSRLSKIPKLDQYINWVNEYGNVNGWGYQDALKPTMQNLDKEIEALPKLLGGDTRHFDDGEFAWLMVKTFFNNGGYQRDWKDKSDPLDLRPIIVYYVEAEYKEPAVNYGVMWGIVFDADNESEAGEKFLYDPYKYESDRENQDQDDHGEMEVYEIGKSDKKELVFSKGVLGIS